MKKVLLLIAVAFTMFSCKKNEVPILVVVPASVDSLIFAESEPLHTEKKPASDSCVQNIGIAGIAINGGYQIQVTSFNPDNKNKILLLKVVNAVGTMIIDEVIKVNKKGMNISSFTITSGDGPWIISVIDPCNGSYTRGQYGYQ